MDWLRNLNYNFIFKPVEFLDDIQKDLEEKFINNVIFIEKKEIGHQPSECLVIWTVDRSMIDCVENHVKNNFHERFIKVKELGRFEFINKFKQHIVGESSKEIKKINEAGVRLGYNLTCVGSVEIIDEKEKNLKKVIDEVLCKSVELPFAVSSNFKAFLLGTEQMSTVKFEICKAETSRSTSNSCLCGIINNTSISLVQGGIEEQTVDVVVNSTSASLELNAGEISKRLLKKAGPELQKECSAKKKLAFGEIFVTKGYEVPCKHVYHTLGQAWEESSPENAKNVLRKIVTTCLTMAHDNKMSSIAFPPIGCGVLKMPADISASLIFNSIEEFLKKTNPTTLVDIKVAIFEIKMGGTIFQKFSEEFKKLIEKPESGWKRNCGQLIKIYGTSEEDLNQAKDKILSINIR